MLGGIEGRRRRGWQRMRWLDGITDLMDMGLGELGSWWWTGMPGVLWFMVLQRVGQDRATELNWTVWISPLYVHGSFATMYWLILYGCIYVWAPFFFFLNPHGFSLLKHWLFRTRLSLSAHYGSTLDAFIGSTEGTLGALRAHQPLPIYSSLKISNSIQLGSSVSEGLLHTDLPTETGLGNVLRVSLCRNEGGKLGQEEKLHWIQRQEYLLPSHRRLSSLGQDPEMLHWLCWQLGRVWKGTEWMRTIQNSTRATRITAELQWKIT